MPTSAKRALLDNLATTFATRRRRHVLTAIAAARASVSRMTLKVEKGDPGVAMGTYATVLCVLGLSERLAEVADPAQDKTASTRCGTSSAADTNAPHGQHEELTDGFPL